MKKKKTVSSLILMGVLAMSYSPVALGANLISAPFNSAAALREALKNGAININSENIDSDVKGIDVEDASFNLADKDVELNIQGFVNSSGSFSDAVAISAISGDLELKKVTMNFVDNQNYDNGNVYGILNFDGGRVKLGENSTIKVDGHINDMGELVGIQTGLQGMPGHEVIDVGDGLTLKIKNNGSGKVKGLNLSNNAVGNFGKNMNVDIISSGSITYGVEIFHAWWLGDINQQASTNIGDNATIKVRHIDQGGPLHGLIGIKVDNGIVNIGKGLNLTVVSDKVNSGVGIDVISSKVLLGGGKISVINGDKIGTAIKVVSSELVGSEGKYNIIGNIYNGFGAYNAYHPGSGKINLNLGQQSYFMGYFDSTTSDDSSLSLRENSVWDMTNKSALNHLVNDQSTIDMTKDNGQFSTLMVGELSGKGIIKLDIDSTRNINNSDSIYVERRFTGEQTLDIYDYTNDRPIGAEAIGTIVAKAHAGQDGKFVVQDAEGTLFWKKYEIAKGPLTNFITDWYLKDIILDTTTPTVGVETVLASNSLSYHTWRNENDKLLKRMGELRLNGEETEGIWVRMQGAKIGRDGNYNFKNNYKSYELGYDQTVLKTDAKTRYVGGAFTYTDGNSSYESGNGDNSSKSLSLYATEIGAKGHYIDVVLKASTMDNDFKVYDSHNKKITGDMNNKGLSLSAEYGRKNKLENGWYYEPQAQFTLGRLSGDDYTTSNGVKVDQSSINTAVARMGINVGKEIGNKGIVYAKVNLLHEFAGDYDVTMRSGSDRLKKSESFDDTWFEYGIGAAFTTSKNGQVYFDVERSSGSDFTKDWQWNIGARWTF